MKNLKKKMSSKEELIANSKELKDSIEDQFENLRDRLEGAGKIGLMAGGGILAVWLLSKIFHSDDAEEDEQMETESSKKTKKKKKKHKPVFKTSGSAGFLMDTVKEQAILFALGMAANQLRIFLKELEEKHEKKGSE